MQTITKAAVGTAPDAEYKAMVLASEAEVDIPKCAIHYLISTSEQDREGDIVLPKAFDLTQHQKNPIGLFEHDFGITLGCWEDENKVYSVKYTNDNELEGTLYFNQCDYNAMTVFEAAVKGVCRACSPGFIVKKFEANEKTLRGSKISLAEMVEISACVVGENPDALVMWVEKSFNKIKDKVHPTILAKLKSFIPERKATMVITKKAESGSEKKEEKKDDEKKDEKKEEEKRPMTAGQKAYDAVHSAAVGLKTLISEQKALQDSDDITTVLGEAEEVMTSLVTGIEEAYNKKFKDSDTELKADKEKSYALALEYAKNPQFVKELERDWKEALEIMKKQDIEIKSMKEKLEKRTSEKPNFRSN